MVEMYGIWYQNVICALVKKAKERSTGKWRTREERKAPSTECLIPNIILGAWLTCVELDPATGIMWCGVTMGMVWMHCLSLRLGVLWNSSMEV